ncbi:hypothetical protein C5B92_06970 [Rathayibacter sp. AY1A4]|uniref:hypothetical protein n=1 Tax=Rathayibacter sp. AY1A4 TaxID=2080522 RepID=UPI000CE7B1F6|nr:hypothetical protein [Rathayibacter sp. AY1A4]PPF18250.1 hypothetical protein C5B92_06970 [Rathayibacter sp. AY1A4]
MSDTEHHLVLVTRLWASAPTVLGIYTTHADAEAAVADDAPTGPTPDRYHHETWRGGERVF